MRYILNSSSFGQSEGGMFSGLGGQPSAERAGTNVFGATQTFGSSTSAACKCTQFG